VSARGLARPCCCWCPGRRIVYAMADSISVPEGLALSPGDAVEICGLESDSGRKLNGRTGVVAGYQEDKGRYEIRFNEDKSAFVKFQNLKRLDCSPGDFSPGDAVECVGLESDIGRELNGKNGTVTRFVEGTDPVRLEVRFAKGPPKYDYQLVKLKPENLRRVKRNPCKKTGAPKAKVQQKPPLVFNRQNVFDAADEEEVPSSQPALAKTVPMLPFRAGDLVEISGLSSEAGKSMNGQRGVVVRCDDERGRVEVRFDALGGKVQSLKAKNVAVVGFVPGDLVEVSGLESEAGRDLNGQKGTITQYVEEKGRYEVRLLPRKLVNLKPENLSKVMEDSHV